jgi:predicted small secreted protein
MRRKITLLAFLLGACALLSACDKCTGDLQDLRYPGGPKSCRGEAAR